ncbi:phosphoribosylamine--glycine ligase [Virgibacillus kekensis]|uniref:Phosphoribosylamine--glycine ligase n=1 Tax=Virgibacillus kekensis TaxID=202261 RepID=A0ABV9DKU8_9BACI
MNILVVGRGGREHSIVMKLAESDQVTTIYAAPGNGGMAHQAECIAIDEMDIDRLAEFAKEKKIDLTIVGPENPLLAGIADKFHEEGIPVFAPSSDAALIEGSKSFAKTFMQKYDIPTAAHQTFTEADEAKKYIRQKGAPIVIKADGLAAGKGVVVAQTEEEGIQAVDDMLVGKTFADAGAKVVIEECLVGKEFSLMAFVHKNTVYPMIPARDHKRALDHDEGPNTGGMGAYAPVPDISRETLRYTTEEVLQKAADGLVEEERPFTGILYAGLMMTETGPKVIEFNARFGDPETQVILPLLKNDLAQVMMDILEGKDPSLEWKNESCTGIVLASAGYPGSYDKGVQLESVKESPNGFIVHAGTRKTAEGLVSDGGRVLLAGATGATVHQAAEASYKMLEPYADSGAFFYRKDIGQK